MLENLMVSANRLTRARNAASLSRSALLASTMLLTSPQIGWANEIFDGVGNVISSDLDAEGIATVGSANDGELKITSGATLTSSSAYIGSTVGVKGEAAVTGTNVSSSVSSSWLIGSQLHVGELSQGFLTISNGGYVKSEGTWIGLQASGDGTVAVTGQGSQWINDYTIILGPNGSGTLSVEDGGRVEAEDIRMAGGNNGVAAITVDGPGSSLKMSSDLSVAYAGNGTLDIKNGGVVTNARGLLGISAGGKGNATVNGESSLWKNTSNLTIGKTGTGILTIADGGVVSVGTQQQNGSFNGTTYIAQDSGSTGTLIIGAAEGEDAAGAGTLKTNTIKFSQSAGLSNGTIVFNHTGSDYLFSADMKGYGKIHHLSGATTLSGDSSDFFGLTNVDGGALYVSGALGGTIIASSGGTIGGEGTIGTTTIEDGGVLSPGGLQRIIYSRSMAPASSAIGMLTINGDLVLKDGSTYAVDLSGSDTDLTKVSRTVSIETGSSVRVTSLDNATSYQNNKTYKIISSNDGLTGTFTNLVNTASAFLDITNSYDTDNAYLNVSLKSSGNSGGGSGVFEPVAKTTNQRSVASALDTLDQTSGSESLALYNSLLLLDETQAQKTYQQLSGDVYATAQGAFVQTNRAVNTALNSRVRAVTDGVAAPSSMALGYAEEKETPKDEHFAAFEPKKSFDPDRFATWINGFGSWGKVSGMDGESDTKTSNGGFLVGGDVAIRDDWRVGVLGGYSRSFFDTDNSNGNSSNYHIGAYSGTKWGPVAFRSGVNYTWNDVGTTRNVTALGQTLNGDYDAASFNMYGELAYRLDVGKSALEPFAALAHSRTKTDGFAETGGSAALTVDSSTMNTTFTTLGLRTSTDLDLAGVASVARGTVGWLHAFGDVDPVSSARFLTGDSFAVSSTPIDRNAALLEAGVDFTITPSSTISLTYNGQIGANAYDHGANAKLRVKF